MIKVIKTIALLLTIMFICTCIPCVGVNADSVSEGELSEDVSGDEDESGNNPYRYTIKFDLNLPSYSKREDVVTDTMTDMVCDSNQDYTLSANLMEIKYCTFAKWNTEPDGTGDSYNNGARVANLCTRDGDTIILYAQWTKTEYTVTYVLNGATVNPNLNKFDHFSSYVLLAPTFPGYSFGGWYTDSSFVSAITTIENIEKDIAIYAKWNPNSYTIRFNANGGSGSMADRTVLFSDVVILPDNAFTKNFYSFWGWNTMPDGTGVSYANLAAVSRLTTLNKGTVTLYAMWTPASYKITYKLSGGKNSTKNPASYTYVTETFKLANPTKTGYSFKGWYTDSKYKNKITHITKGSAGDITLYAKWEANKYSVIFKGNGGKGSMKAMKNLVYNKNYKLTANAYTRKDYVFVGWNTKKDGSGTSYSNKEKVSKLVSQNGKSITLYAQWKKISYNIKFNGNGATSGKMTKITNIAIGKTYKLPKNQYTRSGYVFKGWSLSKNGKGSLYLDEAEIKDLSTKNGETITLYAVWRRKSSDIPDVSDEEMFNYFVSCGMTSYGAAGLMGNLFAESGLVSTNLENSFNQSLGMSDEEYTDAVDDGTYINFVVDRAGYGLAQWTTAGRKYGLLTLANDQLTSIGDKKMQLQYLISELQSKYSGVYSVLCSATSIREASDAVLCRFEMPRDQSESAKVRRASYGIKYYNLYAGSGGGMTEEDCPFTVSITIANLSIRSGPGTNYDRVGFAQAINYVIDHVQSGEGSSMGWGHLQSGEGWVSLDYCIRVD